IHGRVDVVPLAHEARMRADPDQNVEVARLAAEQSRMSCAGEPDPLAVVDAGRNFDLDRALVEHASVAAAPGAGMLDDAARATAAPAGLALDELAKSSPRNVLGPAGAAAC